MSTILKQENLDAQFEGEGVHSTLLRFNCRCFSMQLLSMCVIPGVRLLTQIPSMALHYINDDHRKTMAMINDHIYDDDDENDDYHYDESLMMMMVKMMFIKPVAGPSSCLVPPPLALRAAANIVKILLLLLRAAAKNIFKNSLQAAAKKYFQKYFHFPLALQRNTFSEVWLDIYSAKYC